MSTDFVDRHRHLREGFGRLREAQPEVMSGFAKIHGAATRDEVTEAIGVAVLMGGGPAAVYGSDALDAIDQFSADR